MPHRFWLSLPLVCTLALSTFLASSSLMAADRVVSETDGSPPYSISEAKLFTHLFGYGPEGLGTTLEVDAAVSGTGSFGVFNAAGDAASLELLSVGTFTQSRSSLLTSSTRLHRLSAAADFRLASALGWLSSERLDIPVIGYLAAGGGRTFFLPLDAYADIELLADGGGADFDSFFMETLASPPALGAPGSFEHERSRSPASTALRGPGVVEDDGAGGPGPVSTPDILACIECCLDEYELCTDAANVELAERRAALIEGMQRERARLEEEHKDVLRDLDLILKRDLVRCGLLDVTGLFGLDLLTDSYADCVEEAEQRYLRLFRLELDRHRLALERLLERTQEALEEAAAACEEDIESCQEALDACVADCIDAAIIEHRP